MGFHEFCDALLEVARRKSGLKAATHTTPNHTASASADTESADRSNLAAALERVLKALPGGAEAAQQQANRTAAATAAIAAKSAEAKGNTAQFQTGGAVSGRRDSREQVQEQIS